MSPAPVTTLGWARYYACRPGRDALHLSFWYLLLTLYHGDRLEDDMHTAG
jgi:hypothetical protein